MRAEQIAAGDTLCLKRARQSAYEKESPYVVVTSVVANRNGYRTPWVVSGSETFKPADFDKKEAAIRSEGR